MGWRDKLAKTLADEQNDNGDGTRSDVYYPPNPKLAAWAERALRAMPAPDRIGLARELLAGTGRVVAREVRPYPDEVEYTPPLMANPDFEWWMGGWNACRAAMLEDEG